METQANRSDNRGIIFLLVFGAALRIKLLFSEFQYDELWSILNFTPLENWQIFTDLSLPNNHPINTLVLKFLLQFGSSILTLRSGVFIAGLGVIFLLWLTAGGRKHPRTALTAAAFAAFSPPLILYSASARGYIWQCAGLLICVYGLMNCGRANRKKLREYFPEFLIFAGGLLAVTSVPTGILFLIPAAVGFLIFSTKEQFKSKAVWSSAVALALVLLAYYLINFKALRSGQSWGIEFTSVSGYLHFFVKTIYTYLPLPLAVFVLCALIFDRKSRILMLLSLFPLLAALLTRGGPERTYLPLAMVYAYIAAGTMDPISEKFPRIRRLLPEFVILSALSFYLLTYRNHQPVQPSTDWHNAISVSRPSDLPITSSSSTFILRCNLPRSVTDFHYRCAVSPKTSLLMLGVADRIINGADRNYSEQSVTLGFSGSRSNDFDGFIYTLTPTTELQISRPHLIVYRADSSEQRKLFDILDAAGQVLRLNIFLAMPAENSFDRKTAGVYFFIPAVQNNTLPSNVELYIISGKKNE